MTGFVLRSSAVKGWPHMDVRAYDQPVPEPYTPSDPQVAAHQLRLLRLEILAPSVMIALFEGEPQMVVLEEPHHGVQFGVQPGPSGLTVPLRDPRGSQVLQNGDAIPVTVPTRRQRSDVLRVAALRDALQDATRGASAGDPADRLGVLRHLGAESALAAALPGHRGPRRRCAPGDRPYVQVAQIVEQAGVLASVKLILGVH